MQEIKKIVIIGPESTGKSSLSGLLAEHYHTLWCPEYAREYLLEHGTNYTYEDLLHIARGQVQLQNDYLQKVEELQPANGLLFVDTDLYVMKVWCEYVFNQCHTYILEEIANQKTDLYLLCNIDLPWVRDELREYPDIERRKELYLIYKDLLTNQQTAWVEICGDYEQRKQMAIEAVDALLR